MSPNRKHVHGIVTATAVLVAGVVILSSFGLALNPNPRGNPATTVSPAGAGPTSVAPGFREAIAVMSKSSGPAASDRITCQLTGGLEARCATPEVGDPTTSQPLPGFQNSTSGGAKPPGTYLGNLAWDIAGQEAVFFGGWNGSGVTNQTWLFQAGTWVNATDPADSPPARYGAAMAYDNQTGVGAIVLFGGCNPVGMCPMNDTWLFSAGSWQNLTPHIGNAPKLSNATMTSWGQNGTILFGGCEQASCSALSNATWTFQDTAECQHLGFPCWSQVSAAGVSPPGLAGVALASWPLAGPSPGFVVLYGGYNRSCPVCDIRDSNATWLFTGAQWINATPIYFGGPYPNASRSFASFFWDPLSNDLYLYGGVNTTTGEIYDQLWVMTSLYTWSQSDWSLPTPARLGPAIAGVPPGLGSTLRALLLGGVDTAGTMERGMWVFEPSVVTRWNVLPRPEAPWTTNRTVETNTTVWFFSNASGGTLPALSWSTGDGGEIPSGNGTDTYHHPEWFVARLTATDEYGVQNTSIVNVTAHLFSLDFSPPAAVDQSVLFNFLAEANGTAPYGYTWTFSDGTAAHGASVLHAFSATGPATVALSVRDGTGTIVNQSASFRVNSPLTASAVAKPVALDVDTTTNFSVTASNGTPPYTPLWTLPGNHTVVGTNFSFRPAIAGVYDVNVAVTDRVGATWTDALTLTVNPALSFTVSWSSNAAALGRSVTFSTVVKNGTNPYTYSWEFGDGGSSSAPSPTHTYSKAGTFTVSVWVNDSGGGSFRQTVEVKIPRTSNGLLWQILGLPMIDLVAILAGLVVFVLAVVALVHHGRKREATPGMAKAPPGRPKA